MIRNLASAVCSQAVVHVMGKGATCLKLTFKFHSFGSIGLRELSRVALKQK